MIIRSTALLSKKIHTPLTQSLPLDPNPFADWTARLFTAHRVQYIVVSNTISLYSTLMFGKGVIDASSFIRRLESSLKEQLISDGFSFHYERLIAPSITCVAHSKAISQSVTGSMNDIVKHAKFHISERDLSPIECARKVSELPMKSLNYQTPIEVFKKMKP
jgi:hypothetical protein